MKTNILKETVRGIQPISLEDDFMSNRKIFLTEEVTKQSCVELMKQILFLDKENPSKEITLFINSPGGSVMDGFIVYDAIMNARAPVRTVCFGLAASMGAVLFLAGEEREIYEHSQVMIHDPSLCLQENERQKMEDIDEKLKKIKIVRKEICELIANRTGKSLKEVYQTTKKDSFFNAEEAVNYGLATNIIKSRKENLDGKYKNICSK